MANYDPTTALLVVDVQNDFADPAAASTCEAARRSCRLSTSRYSKRARQVPESSTRRTGTRLHAALQKGRRHLAGPLRSRDLGRRASSGPNHRRASRAKGNRRRGRLLGVQPAPPGERRKDRDDLAELLLDAGITRLVIGGLTTDYCVLWTVLDARDKGYPITVLENAMRAVDLEEETATAPSRRCSARAPCSSRGPL